MTTELSKIQNGRTVKCNSNYAGTMRTREIRKCYRRKLISFTRLLIFTGSVDFDW